MLLLSTYNICCSLFQVQKFRCRARVGRGGRVIFDRLPVRDNVGLGAGSVGDPIVVYSTRKAESKGVHDAWKLLPPFYLPNVDQAQFKEVCVYCCIKMEYAAAVYIMTTIHF